MKRCLQAGRRRPPGQRGFTLVELMVAMTLVTLLIGVAFQIGVVVINGFREHREAVAVQRAARAAIDLMADSVRNAAVAVPTAVITDTVGCNDFDGLDVRDNDDAPDELLLVTGGSGVITSLRAQFNQSSSTMTLLDGSGIVAGDLLVVSDFQKGHVVKVATVTDNGDTWQVDVAAAACAVPTFEYNPGAIVLRAHVARFFVADVDDVPTLQLDPDGEGGPLPPEPLAEGIEDLQVAVGIDTNGDGLVQDQGTDEDEWHYNVALDSPPEAITTRRWRALRLTVVGRSLREDVGAELSFRPAAENREAGNLDGFRRRVASTVVELRNLEGSP
jgi:prepilin-type N-terminal cleavage/methylation domain-containing protein